MMEPTSHGQNQTPCPALVSRCWILESLWVLHSWASRSAMARAKLFPIGVVRPQESATVSWDWLIRRPSLAANRAGQKRSPDRRQVLRSGLPTWRVEVTLRPPPRDPLKRDSHTLVRLRFIDKDASAKENHCDIFATVKPSSRPHPLGGHALMPKPLR